MSDCVSIQPQVSRRNRWCIYIYILCDKTSTCVKNQFSVCMCVCVATQSAWAPDLKPRRCQRHAHLVTSRLRRQTSQRGTNSPGVTAPGVSSQRVRLKGRGKAGVSPVWRKPCDVFFFTSRCCMIKLAYIDRDEVLFTYTMLMFITDGKFRKTFFFFTKRRNYT